MNLNRVELIGLSGGKGRGGKRRKGRGDLGSEPETTYTPSGKAVDSLPCDKDVLDEG